MSCSFSNPYCHARFIRLGLTALVSLSPPLLQVGRTSPVPPVQTESAQVQSIDLRKVEADRLLLQGEQIIRQAYRSRESILSPSEQKSLVQSALDTFQQALKLYQEMQELSGEVKALENLGYAYMLLENKPKELESYQQLLNLYQDMKDARGEGKTLEKLGDLYFSLRDNQKALESFQQLLSLYRNLKNSEGEARVLDRLGTFYQVLTNYEQANKYYQQAFSLYQKIDPRILRDRVEEVGSFYYEQEEYEWAVQYYQQLLNLHRESQYREGEAIALFTLGNIYYRLGNYEQALESLQPSLAFSREKQDYQGEAVMLHHLGRVYSALEKHEKAIEYYQQSLAVAKKLHDRYLLLEMELYADLGLTLFKLGKLIDAESYLQTSIQLHEIVLQNLNNLQKAGGTLDNPLQGWHGYNSLQKILIAQNKIESALEISEQGRTRASAELLVERTQGKDPFTLPPIRIAEIQKIARKHHATLVEYAHIKEKYGKITKEEKLLVWVIQPTGKVTLRQIDLNPLKHQKTSLDNLVMAARCLGTVHCETAVASRGSQPLVFNVAQGEQEFVELSRTSTYHPYLQRLHQLLIHPIADLLPINPEERVIFIPQGRLFLLPFAALQDNQGKYLLEKHTISFAPSIQILQLIQQNKPQQLANTAGNILLVGNPTMPTIQDAYSLAPPAQLSALPEAEKEAKAISELLNVPALIGPEATKIAVLKLMPEARIIHLATHGLLDKMGDSLLPGAIALAPTDLAVNDGLLTAREILELDLKLKAELVVLSACDTGRGKITGDGVLGLSRSFITAGVPTVIVSLWAVPDAPTASLMTRFYQNLNQGQDKTQSLRQAMLETKKNFPDPRSWAAFTLIGAPE